MRLSRPRSVRIAAVLLAIPAAAAFAQQRPLTPEDWDHWKSITGTALSRDGRWAVYSLVPQVGDGELVIRSTQGATEYHVPRGFIGRPQMVAGARDTTGGAPPAQITADSRTVVALTYAPMSDYDRARREKRRPSAQPTASLALVNLADGHLTTVPRVRSFRLPRESGGWLAYLLEPSDSASENLVPRDSGRASAPARIGATPGGRLRPVAADSSHARREYGSTLVLRNLATGAEQRIADVVSYTFDDSARWLGYTVSSRAAERDGAYIARPGSGTEVALLSGRGTYRPLVFDRAGTQVAFVADRDDADHKGNHNVLYYSALNSPAAQPIVASPAVGDGMIVAPNGRVAFTRDGHNVLFGIAPEPLDSIPADSLYGKAVFDLWSWKDARLQPQQRVEAGRDRSRSFEAIYHLATRTLVQLANDSMPLVSVSPDGRVALAATSERYAIERTWGDDGDDIWVIDAATGARKRIREKISGNAELSPDGRYVVFFDQGHWYAYGTATNKLVDLNAALAAVSFAQETWDTPSTPAPWGVAGFTKGDRSLLVYDRYDLWELDPSGVQRARIVTDSVGRREHLVFRLAEGAARGRRAARTTDDDRGIIDPEEPLLLRAFDEDTKASGFYRDRLGVTRPPEKLVMADVAFGPPIKAENADQYVVTKGTFTEFPDLYTGRDLARLTRISDANPQQKDFKWGSVELVHWTSTDGVPLSGLLYKPADFDPGKKYPLIAYFYEQLSDNLHSYIPPAGRNVINPTHYTSNGYLVFEPDIHYEMGYPGPSAMKSILPGVQMLLARGYVDSNALGLQGQSWGGYQTAYLITQTHMFRAAMAGAPVANMTSAYGGIRWGPGVARAFQYEKTQSRIGGSIWQYPMRYFENSPLFWADKVTTPLLIMSNDADDAVPWYQGIELFVALRRLQREVYLIDYNGDVHNPTKRANQKDIAMRMQQFFDYHLRGYPEPDWMLHGIPYQLKGRDQLGHTAVQAGEAARSRP
ncbi:MAG TPA: prolyl oligopeptidase family serine peptidase [Gemmatimonadaceae bacterium]|nr:prolyl oligopeptidase family serine peptidase [Gemmatimonadaceae bacterium]